MDVNQAADIIKHSGIKERDQLVALLRPSIRIRTGTEEIDPSSPVSRFGGLPLLPTDCSWPHWDASGIYNFWISHFRKNMAENPQAGEYSRKSIARYEEKLKSSIRPLTFLGQLELAALPTLSSPTQLPTAGRLLFFYDVEEGTASFHPANRGAAQVLYVRGSDNSRAVDPPEAIGEDFPSRARALSFTLEQTLPIDARVYGLNLRVWDKDNRYQQLITKLMPEEDSVHRIGGYAENVQNPMELECQLVTNGIYCGDASGYKDPRRKVLEPGAVNWRLLLQIDSDENMKWMWGDAGKLYYWIRKQDLAEEAFENIWGIEQCH